MLYHELLISCQDTIRNLQDKAGESGEKVVVDTQSIPEIINFKIQAEETKAHAKVCKFIVKMLDHLGEKMKRVKEVFPLICRNFTCSCDSGEVYLFDSFFMLNCRFIK